MNIILFRNLLFTEIRSLLILNSIQQIYLMSTGIPFSYDYRISTVELFSNSTYSGIYSISIRLTFLPSTNSSVDSRSPLELSTEFSNLLKNPSSLDGSTYPILRTTQNNSIILLPTMLCTGGTSNYSPCSQLSSSGSSSSPNLILIGIVVIITVFVVAFLVYFLRYRISQPDKRESLTEFYSMRKNGQHHDRVLSKHLTINPMVESISDKNNNNNSPQVTMNSFTPVKNNDIPIDIRYNEGTLQAPMFSIATGDNIYYEDNSKENSTSEIIIME